MTYMSFFVKFFVFNLLLMSISQSSTILNSEKSELEPFQKVVNKERISYIRTKMDYFYFEGNFLEAVKLGDQLLKSSECTLDDQRKIIDIYCKSKTYKHFEALELSARLASQPSEFSYDNHVFFLKTFSRVYNHVSEDYLMKWIPEVKKSHDYVLNSALITKEDLTVLLRSTELIDKCEGNDKQLIVFAFGKDIQKKLFS